MVWKQPLDFNQYHGIGSVYLGDIEVLPGTSPILIDSIFDQSQFENIAIVRVELENDFVEATNAYCSLEIKGVASNQTNYYHQRYFLHFANDDFAKQQTGNFDFVLGPLENPLESKKLIFRFIADNREYMLKDVKLILLSK